MYKWIYSLCFTVVVLLASCSADKEFDTRSFTFALSGEPDTLDPHATTGTLTFQITHSIYDTLFQLSKEGSILPRLAHSVTLLPDGEIEVLLRDDVYFHHGKHFTAEDVMASFERLRSPDFASPSGFEYDSISSISIINDYHLNIRLKKAQAPFFATLASGWSAILPADLIASDHNFARNPVGTGPFRFSDWNNGVSINLEKNDEYWEEDLPLLQEVKFDLLKDTVIRTQALIDNTVQGIDLVVEPELSRLKEYNNVEVYQTLSSLVLVLALNHRVEILSDLEFRQAINAAIDKESVLEIAYGGGEVVSSFMDPNSPYYTDLNDKYAYDPDYAREVFSRKQAPRELVISVPQNFAPHVKAAELYQDMLRVAGLETRIKLLEWSSWISQVYRNAEFDITVIGHTGKLDPDGRLTGYGTEEVYVGWRNENVANMIENARTIFDVGIRKRMYNIVLRTMADELPFIFIGSPYRHIALKRGTKSLKVDPVLDTYDFKATTFK